MCSRAERNGCEVKYGRYADAEWPSAKNGSMGIAAQCWEMYADLHMMLWNGSYIVPYLCFIRLFKYYVDAFRPKHDMHYVKDKTGLLGAEY